MMEPFGSVGETASLPMDHLHGAEVGDDNRSVDRLNRYPKKEKSNRGPDHGGDWRVENLGYIPCLQADVNLGFRQLADVPPRPSLEDSINPIEAVARVRDLLGRSETSVS